jgi:hypothetical protein
VPTTGLFWTPDSGPSTLPDITVLGKWEIIVDALAITREKNMGECARGKRWLLKSTAVALPQAEF